MPVLVGPAIDTTLSGAAEVFVSAEQLTAPIPPPPAPGTWLDFPSGRAPVVQVLLGRAITREVIGELTTADTDDWDEDVELLAGATSTLRASVWDPLWEACAESVTMGADGYPKYVFDPGGFVVWVYVDSVCEWVGRFTEPVGFGDGTVGLPAQGPQSVFDERILGRAEQVDLLGDRGSFERYSSIAEMVADGWRFPAGMLAELVPGEGVRGDQCLRIKGEGWVESPRVTVMGSDGYGRAVKASAFGRWNQKARQGAGVVRTWVQRTDSLGPSNVQVTKDATGTRPPNGEAWTDNPIDSGARMSPQKISNRAWGAFRGFGGLWSYYDLLRIVESIQTGYPKGVNKDLAEYVVRIVGHLHSRSMGGSPTGLTTRIMAMTGTTASMRWEHAKRTKVRDILSMVLNAEGGPECRITNGWVLEIWDRLGSDRSDISLSVHEILKPGWKIDPGARIQDFAVDTGRGSGAIALVAVVSQPQVDDMWRRYAEVTGPVERDLNEIESWTRAHARVAARIQATAEVEVPWHVAKQIVCGDVLWVTQHAGHTAAPTVRMRVLRIRWNPKKLTATLTLGAHSA